MAALADEDQLYLIAVRLNMEAETAFKLYLAMIWKEKEWLTKLPAGAELRRLQVTREGIEYILARNRDKRDIKMGTISRRDGQMVTNLKIMLDAVQDDINVLINRTQSRPAVTGILQAGLLAPAAPGDPTRGTT